jgi:hypothetical protein
VKTVDELESIVNLSGLPGFQNDGDNEITGFHVSDGDPTPNGLLGAKQEWKDLLGQSHWAWTSVSKKSTPEQESAQALFRPRQLALSWDFSVEASQSALQKSLTVTALLQGQSKLRLHSGSNILSLCKCLISYVFISLDLLFVHYYTAASKLTLYQCRMKFNLEKLMRVKKTVHLVKSCTLSIDQAIAVALGSVGGKVFDVKVKQMDQQIVWRIKLVRSDARVKVYVEDSSGKIIEAREEQSRSVRASSQDVCAVQPLSHAAFL